MYSVNDTSKRWVSPFGHPRIKACLTAPRGLSWPTTSFIASSCQGIHHARFVAWPHNHGLLSFSKLSASLNRDWPYGSVPNRAASGSKIPAGIAKAPWHSEWQTRRVSPWESIPGLCINPRSWLYEKLPQLVTTSYRLMHLYNLLSYSIHTFVFGMCLP